ncbi:MAG: lysyl oxidase family protein [bacterium]|nr:lysyl oxidase family protein [bacterium]
MISQLVKEVFVICLLIATGVGFGISYHNHLSQISSILSIEQAPLLPDGTLIKPENSEQVYYIEKSKKRWIDSKLAFHVQGLKQENIITIPDYNLRSYPDGEILTKQSHIILPNEAEVLPDLVSLAFRDLHLAKKNGRTILRFSALFWNQGKGPFQLVADPALKIVEDGYQDVYQHLDHPSGGFRNKTVGIFFWHKVHTHYHYGDFADYVLTLVKPSSKDQVLMPPTITQKTTFCLRDNEPIALGLPGAPRKKFFSTCGRDRQGVSMGWADLYKYDLPDQYLDIHDLPAGIYSFSLLIDPRQRFVEIRKDNNISTVLLELDPKKNLVKVIASGAPFLTDKNQFADGIVIRSGGNGEAYTIHNNKKRWLRSSEVFDSYGYKWEGVYVFPESIIDVIPRNNLIRLTGTNEVYIINDVGYKRHILNSEVFRSYGFIVNDIADINSTEFASYPESNLIRRTGSGEIYLIKDTDPLNQSSSETSKKKIEIIDITQNLEYNLDAVHSVNEVDFNSYTAILN